MQSVVFKAVEATEEGASTLPLWYLLKNRENFHHAIMNIGQTIKMFRIGLNIKQRDFAVKVGVSPNYLYLVESGKRDPSLAFVKNVSKALRVPMGVLFMNEETEPKIGKEASEIYDKLKALILQVQQLGHNSGKKT